MFDFDDLECAEISEDVRRQNLQDEHQHVDKSPAIVPASPPRLSWVGIPKLQGLGRVSVGKWWGSCEGPDGSLYCAPYGAPAALRVALSSDSGEGIYSELLSGLGVPNHPERFRHPKLVCSETVEGEEAMMVCAPSGAESCLRIKLGSPASLSLSCFGISLGTNVQGGELSKFMGSIVAGRPDGYNGTTIVYAPPYSHKSVLRVDGSRQRCELIGDFGPVPYKYWNGAVAADNAIYVPPYAASQVLRIGPEQTGIDSPPECRVVGPDLNGFATTKRKFKWMGGVATRDGCVYGIPYEATGVLRIDPAAQDPFSVLKIDGMSDLEIEATGKWTDGVLAGDGAIYCIPHNARHVLRIDPSRKCAETVGPDLSNKNCKWMGGVLGPDGRIYGVPQDANSVLRIEPSLKPSQCRVDTFGEVGAETMKWRSGATLGNKVLFLPFSCEHILAFDPTSP